MSAKLTIKRVYETPLPEDGYRILIDRLWPRGLTKEKAAIDLWLKEIAPSSELRKWFQHEPEKWPEFQKRYGKEIRDNKEAVQTLERALREQEKVTLVFGSKEERYNDAVVLLNTFS